MSPEQVLQLSEENAELRAELNRVNEFNIHLLDGLKEIRDIALISEGVEFYAVLAEQAIRGKIIV